MTSTRQLVFCAIILAFTLAEHYASGQTGWNQPVSLPPLACPPDTTPAPVLGAPQSATLAPTATPTATFHCTPGYRDINDWSQTSLPTSCSNQSNQASTPAGMSLGGASAYRDCNPWYASGAGLIMGREDTRRVWTTYETNNNPNQLMSSDDADPDWEGGFEVHIGRQFACNAYAIDLGYWMIDDFQASASQTHANFVSTPLQFNDLEFGAADPVGDYYNTAAEHRISRRNSIHNIELNLIENNINCGSCNTWRSRKSVGLRYFHFDEDFYFSTLDQGGTWGGNGGADEVTLTSSTENNLLGVQLGFHLDRQWEQNCTFFITPKFGVYNNRVKHRFDLRRGDGVAAMPSAFSGVTGSYPVSASTDVVSFLSEVNVGISWQPTCRLTFFGGYRAVALTSIGLADSQIPQFIVDIPEIADVDAQDSLILHGAFAGIVYSL